MLLPSPPRWIVLSLLLFPAACTTVAKSQPARSATEQLLISTAADRAIAGLHTGLAEGTRCTIIDSRFEGYDKAYAISAIEAHLLKEGLLVTSKPEEADVLVEIRAGALSVNNDSFLLGIPAIGIPVPAVGSFEFPELALFKRDHQEGVARFALFAKRRTDGSLVASCGPSFGNSYVTDWNVLLVPFTTGDVMPDD